MRIYSKKSKVSHVFNDVTSCLVGERLKVLKHTHISTYAQHSHARAYPRVRTYVLTISRIKLELTNFNSASSFIEDVGTYTGWNK